MRIRNTMGLVTFIGVIALLSATDANAQRRGANQGSGGWGPQAAYAVQIKGSRITFEGKPAIIAAEVKKGDEVFQLRDETGVLKWSGWRS